MMRWLVLGFGLSGCVTLGVPHTERPDLSVPMSPPGAARRCDLNDERSVPRNAFHLPGSTRYVVLDFQAASQERDEIDLGRQAAGAVQRLLRDDLASIAGEGASPEERRTLAERIEVIRLQCVPDDDAAAREIGRIMSADLVLWGNANPPAAGSRSKHVDVRIDTKQQVSSNNGATAQVNGGMHATIHLSSQALKDFAAFDEGSYSVRAAVTAATDFPVLKARWDRPSPASAARAALELPAVVGGNAYSLILYVAGLHFYQHGEPLRALRFFGASRSLTKDALVSADLLWLMGDAELRASDVAAAIKHFEYGLKKAQPGNRSWWKLNLSLLGALPSAGQITRANDLANELLRKVHRGQMGDELRAFILSDLASGLDVLGRRREALEACRAAVSTYERLAAGATPEVFQSRLANARLTFAARLDALGERQEAIEQLRQAVDIDRKLAASRPGTYTADLAKAMGDLLSRLGQQQEDGAPGAPVTIRVGPDEAPETITIGLNVRGSLAMSPEGVQADFGGSLLALSKRLASLGKRQEALETSQWGEAIFRRLANESAEFEADHAGALGNLSERYGALQRWEEALATGGRSVEMLQRLVEARPGLFENTLASALLNLSARQREAGKRGAALESVERAVRIRESLSEANPEVYKQYLVTALYNLSICLSAAGGKDEEALKAITRAVAILEPLATAQPELHEEDLAKSLAAQANRLTALKRWKEAVKPMRRAVDIRRRLAQARPEHVTSLVVAQERLADILAETGDWTGAAAAKAEAGALRHGTTPAEPRQRPVTPSIHMEMAPRYKVR